MENAKIGSRRPSIDMAAGKSPESLREATQQMESLFITQLMKSMRGTVPASHLLSSGKGEQLFREMLDQELAGRVAQSGGFGIGEMLYQQLSRQERAS
jgi:flagellar protein FlgJ